MNQAEKNALQETCKALAQQRLPRWDALPDLELYMDQVLSLVGRYLDGYPGFDGKGLTGSMVNNYVKLGVMPAPVKKKYTRTHLAHLLIICVLKPVLPIPSIRRLIEAGLAQQDERALYDSFCALMEETCAAAAESHLLRTEESAVRMLCRAALRAQAEQALAMKLGAETSKDA